MPYLNTPHDYADGSPPTREQRQQAYDTVQARWDRKLQQEARQKFQRWLKGEEMDETELDRVMASVYIDDDAELVFEPEANEDDTAEFTMFAYPAATEDAPTGIRWRLARVLRWALDKLEGEAG